ncbi:MAG TPA: hypothetical protein VK668_19775 [Mucilaginibacter sp.]|nr:hypothetical protein [Mucilaginibacter sp.]
MKKACLLLVMPLLIIACKPKPATDATASKTDSVAYPYTIKHADQWLIDTSHANTLTALKALKSFEKNDTVEMKAYFADSVRANFDGESFKGTGKQFIASAKGMRDSYKTLSITMHDWEAVTNKTGKEQWVTAWYKQTSTDAKGKVDSAEYINDFGFKDGKIIMLNEYVRHFKK